VICWSICPAVAAKLRVATLRATIPTRSSPSTPIQARPRVIRTTKLESGSWRTASAVRTAVTTSLGWVVAGRRFGVGLRAGARRAGAFAGAGTARERAGLRAG
jgi:hypothetical protein